MFPIRDLNPTRITPIITVGLIAASLFVYFFWQPQVGTTQDVEFLYEHAAIACELTTGEPLTVAEIRNDSCATDNRPADEVFPEKNVWLAALVSMFLHGSLVHILGNMWFLWIFGNNVEEAFGVGGYLLLYLASGIAATAGFVALNPDTTVPLVGASGAIAGILGAYLVLYPTHQVLTFVFLFFVPVPAILFLGIWFLGQFGVADATVAWEAHVFGFLFGMLVALPFRSVLLGRVASLHQTVRRYA